MDSRPVSRPEATGRTLPEELPTRLPAVGLWPLAGELPAVAMPPPLRAEAGTGRMLVPEALVSCGMLTLG
jgi:hypothetical protein